MSESRFKIVFRELPDLDTDTASIMEIANEADSMLHEEQEIAELRRIVSEIAEPPPVFYSGT